ncbi:AAA family ATPase [Streptomyces sp. NPDC005708]|uniref:helix-turn-helix transcriptional regulator n=1 Tax=Streptomyces sp. NPDC005708 TaxID=3154564 RepID=UPI003401BE83
MTRTLGTRPGARGEVREPLDTTITGRDAERARLSALVTATEGEPLVIQGEAGVGKSALLDHAAQEALERGHLVVRAVGVETESELPFAGLHQLLYPLLQRSGELDPQQSSVFDAVFGCSEDEPPSIMTLGIAVLDLLADLSSDGPVTLVIDDGHWFDAPSTDVCGFVARRLTSCGAKMVIALRTDVTSRWEAARLPELQVEALSDAAARELLDTCHPHLDPEIRTAVLDYASGNPLALIELPRSMADTGPQRETDGGIHPLGIPLSSRLECMYGQRIANLDASVRREMLCGALDGIEAGPTAGHLHSVRYRMRDVDEAVAYGLLLVDSVTGDFVFRHPLVRSALVQLATPNERRAVHAELARAHRHDVERRAGHLAAATIDPDDEVAAALEEAARSATRRGGATTAVAWLTRAAELSEHAADRSRRLADAAFVAGQSALLDQAQQLLDRSSARSGVAASSAAVITSAYQGLYQDGDVKSTHHRVVSAIDSLREHSEEGSDEILTRLLNLLLAISQYAGDRATWERTEQVMDSVADRVHPLTALYRDAWSDVLRRGTGVRQRVERAFADLADLEPWDVMRLAVTAYHADALGDYRSHLQRMVDREKEAGAVTNAMTVLNMIIQDRISSGEWQEAQKTAWNALELTTPHGYELLAIHCRGYLGLVAAFRGEVERAREVQAAIEAWARPRGIGWLTHLAEAIGAAAALSAGDYEAAYQHAIAITAPGTFEPYVQHAGRTILDLVEAALHTGRMGQARQHALAAREANLPDISPRLELVTLGVLAMTTGEQSEAGDLFAQAVSHPAGAAFPFELARICLAQGMWLRRVRALKAARAALARAVELFDRLGAVTWAQRARGELRLAGSPVHRSPASTDVTALTYQERQIAELAASGLSNKEIGARMSLSPRTVGSHLYNIFPKLGVTSRAALRDALGPPDKPR